VSKDSKNKHKNKKMRARDCDNLGKSVLRPLQKKKKKKIKSHQITAADIAFALLRSCSVHHGGDEEAVGGALQHSRSVSARVIFSFILSCGNSYQVQFPALSQHDSMCVLVSVRMC
jgi:hypothetical protein